MFGNVPLSCITKDESGIRVDPFACEGCGLCSLVCPHDAIAMEPALLGELHCIVVVRFFLQLRSKRGAAHPASW